MYNFVNIIKKKKPELHTLKGWVLWHVNFIAVYQKEVIYFHCRKFGNYRKAENWQQVTAPWSSHNHWHLFSVLPSNLFSMYCCRRRRLVLLPFRWQGHNSLNFKYSLIKTHPSLPLQTKGGSPRKISSLAEGNARERGREPWPALWEGMKQHLKGKALGSREAKRQVWAVAMEAELFRETSQRDFLEVSLQDAWHIMWTTSLYSSIPVLFSRLSKSHIFVPFRCVTVVRWYLEGENKEAWFIRVTHIHFM